MVRRTVDMFDKHTPTPNREGYQVGDRVQMHPSTDVWIMGDRYGTIEVLADDGVHMHVRLDKSKTLARVTSSLVIPI